MAKSNKPAAPQAGADDWQDVGVDDWVDAAPQAALPKEGFPQSLEELMGRVKDPQRWQAIALGTGPRAPDVVAGTPPMLAPYRALPSAARGVARMANKAINTNAFTRVGANAASSAVDAAARDPGEGSRLDNANTGATIGGGISAAFESVGGLARLLSKPVRAVGRALTRTNKDQAKTYSAHADEADTIFTQEKDHPDQLADRAIGQIKEATGILNERSTQPAITEVNQRMAGKSFRVQPEQYKGTAAGSEIERAHAVQGNRTKLQVPVEEVLPPVGDEFTQQTQAALRNRPTTTKNYQEASFHEVPAQDAFEAQTQQTMRNRQPQTKTYSEAPVRDVSSAEAPFAQQTEALVNKGRPPVQPNRSTRREWSAPAEETPATGSFDELTEMLAGTRPRPGGAVGTPDAQWGAPRTTQKPQSRQVTTTEQPLPGRPAPRDVSVTETPLPPQQAPRREVQNVSVPEALPQEMSITGPQLLRAKRASGKASDMNYSKNPLGYRPGDDAEAAAAVNLRSAMRNVDPKTADLDAVAEKNIRLSREAKGLANPARIYSHTETLGDVPMRQVQQHFDKLTGSNFEHLGKALDAGRAVNRHGNGLIDDLIARPVGRKALRASGKLGKARPAPAATSTLAEALNSVNSKKKKRD